MACSGNMLSSLLAKKSTHTHTHLTFAGLCLAHLGRLEEADTALASLRADEEVSTLYPDLTLDVGCALAAMGQHARALDYLWRLLVGARGGMCARLLACVLACACTRTRQLQSPWEPMVGADKPVCLGGLNCAFSLLAQVVPEPRLPTVGTGRA